MAAIVALPAVSPAPSHAASRLCRQLEASLAAASSGGTPSQVRKYDAAIVRQREQIAKARGQVRSAGCGFSLFGRNVAACAALNATVDRMNGNLDALQAKRNKLASGGSRRDRARILASLDANGCRDQAVAGKRPPTRNDGNGGLFDRLFGGGVPPLDTLEALDALDDPYDPGGENNVRRIIDEPAGLPRGEFRTLCVRTCDGYFFPMSNAATLRDFERDQKNCESSCPGTDIQVFYTRGLTDDTSTMISSVTGRPYSDLPTAYLYKQPNMSRPQGCGCNAAQNFEIIAGNPPASEPVQPQTESTSFIPAPAAKPDPAADPEPAPSHAPAASASPKPEHKVRVVGPAFLPDPEAAIDLRAPAQKKAQ